jgi:glycosyltransferase involved in cell wall biosynthesis
VLEESAGVTVFHESIRARIAAALPGLGAKIAVIPQSAVLDGGEPFPLAERVALPPGAAVFLFPAGIRMVKAPRFPLGPFEELVLRQPEVRLLYAGPVLDPEEGERLLSALNGRSWATYLGPVPHAQMRSLLEAADVVLNCSISEGGMANSVLEAMALGRPVLASDIEGNRSLVEHEVTGLLFQGPDEFGRSAERLIDDPGLRRRLGLAGREKVGTLYPPEREITGYLAEYHRLAPAPCRLGGPP